MGFQLDFYVKDSPTFDSLGLAKHKSVMAEISSIWLNTMAQRVSLVLLANCSPGADLQPGKPYLKYYS
jgi:hypothetical protein